MKDEILDRIAKLKAAKRRLGSAHKHDRNSMSELAQKAECDPWLQDLIILIRG